VVEEEAIEVILILTMTIEMVATNITGENIKSVQESEAVIAVVNVEVIVEVTVEALEVTMAAVHHLEVLITNTKLKTKVTDEITFVAI
jgi:hypothetical protein